MDIVLLTYLGISMAKINKVRLFVNNNIKSRQAEKIVREEILKEGIQITEEEDFDLGIAIGGDGSFLRMVNETNFKSNCLYVGINAGTLGFAQDITIDEIPDFIKHIGRENYNFEEIGIEEIFIETKEKLEHFYALNEVVIRDENLNTTHMDVLIDHVLLENYVGDGLLVSTSFGSTAYNLSYGGSMVYNEFSTLQITPIAPMNNKSYHTLTNSLIIPSSKIITIIPEKKRNNLLLTIDGNNIFYSEVDKIEVRMNKTIKIIRKKDYNYIRKINDKFIK